MTERRGSADPAALPSVALARAGSGILLVGALGSLALLAFAVRLFGASLSIGPLAWYATFALPTAGLIWCALRLRPVARVTLAISCVFASVLVCGTEAALGLAAQARPVRIQERLATRTGTPFDRRSVPDVVRSLRTSGLDAMPSVVPGIIIPHWAPTAHPRTEWRSALLPLAGVSNRPTVHLCNEDGQFRRYDSDEHGFANPASSWSAPSHELALIGDSFTHGYCVDVDRSYSGRLRSRWPSLLNLGTGGSGPLVELATLSEYATPVRPKAVVWQYFGNDLDNLALERRNPLLVRYLEGGFSQGLFSRQADVDAAIVPWVERMWAAGKGDDIRARFGWGTVLTLYHLRELAVGLLPGFDSRGGPSAELPLFGAILREARDRVARWGGRLYFVFVPEWERYYQPGALAGHDVRDRVLAIARSLDLPVIDLEPVVREHPDRLQLFARHELATAHFSALGHELMAREVIAAIEKDQAVSVATVR